MPLIWPWSQRRTMSTVIRDRKKQDLITITQMNFINVCQYTDTKVILRIHITIQKTEVSKNSNIVKCYYNLKCLKYLN